MNFVSQRVRLTPLSRTELGGSYVDWLNDAEVCKYNSHGEILYTREMALEYIDSLEKDKSKEVYAVYLKETNLHIGNISLQSIDQKNRNAEIAFLFGEKTCWGKGYAEEAAEILIKRAFRDLKLHRVYFGTHVENHAMRRLGEKLGFSYEGTLRDAQCKFGVFNSISVYSILENENEVL